MSKVSDRSCREY